MGELRVYIRDTDAVTGAPVWDALDEAPPVVLPPGNEPPSAVTNLTATPAQALISLSWSPAVDPEGGAIVYRIEQDGVVLDNAWTGTSYTASGLTPSTTYQFAVYATDPQGATSPSAGISATTSAPITVSHGRDLDATNTGIAKHGLTQANLATASSGVISANGAVITNTYFPGGVVITGSNVTLRRCLIEDGGGFSGAVRPRGPNLLLEDCTIRNNGTPGYQGIWGEDGENYDGMTIRGCDVSGFENIMSLNDSSSSVIMEESYFHGSAAASSDGHKDCVEVYGGTNIIFRRSKIHHLRFTETAAINIAPWSGGAFVNGISIEDCDIDGGHMHFVIDLQSSGYIRGVKVKRCDMRGHTTPSVGGTYWAFNGSGNGFVETDAEQASNLGAVVCPTSGPDANYWNNCDGLVPDRSGQILDPESAPIFGGATNG